MDKQLSIDFQIPDGFEVDVQKSDLVKGKIALKEKEIIDYYKVAKSLFLNKTDLGYCYNGYPTTSIHKLSSPGCVRGDLAVTRKQVESILALNKLANVAKYLNGDWKPSGKRYQDKYFLYISHESKISTSSNVQIGNHKTVSHSCVYFKTRDLALKGLNILGGETVRKALTLNH